MKEKFKDCRFRESSRKLIDQANEIIAAYDTDGIQLTLRQLYYQFVSRNWIANDDRNYKNLGAVLSDARLAGLVDWEALDDLNRVPSIPGFYDNRQQFIDMLKNKAETGYVLDHWAGQENYVELWVEKQALMSVLAPIAGKFQVGFQMNKGYCSQTAMYDASKRMIEAAFDFDSGHSEGKRCTILYAGDHDPSGEDMVRDIRDRMDMFGAQVTVKKIALTKAQVTQYKCPPNPAKFSDPRATDYIAQHGRISWEVDALDPKVMRQIAEREIKALLDVPLYNACIDQESRQIKELTKKLSVL
jgi:hypothetical protein